MFCQLLAVVAVVLVTFTHVVNAQDVSKHSIVWDTLLPEPGLSVLNQTMYHNAMPIGNGHVGCNVNYELETDSIAIMIAASSNWLENGETAKVGLLEIQLPSRGGAALTGFKQIFNPQDATVRFHIPPGNAPSQAYDIVTYVDANSDNIVVSITPPDASISATLTMLKPKPVTSQTKYDCNSYTVSADNISQDGKLVYHRNSFAEEDAFYHKTLKSENIPFVPNFKDPLSSRTTGVYLNKILSSSAVTFTATVLTAQTNTVTDYENQIIAVSNQFVTENSKEGASFPSAAHKAWWTARWASHYIDMSSSSPNQTEVNQVATLNRKYVLWRYLVLIQGRTEYPIKFNGQLFVANRPPTQDTIRWGGFNWWQNARHPYYSTLTAGDSDVMKSFIISFNKTLPIINSKVKAYYGFDGYFWPEYTQVLYGTTHTGGPVLMVMTCICCVCYHIYHR